MRNTAKGGHFEEGETEGRSKFLKIKQRNRLSRLSFVYSCFKACLGENDTYRIGQVIIPHLTQDGNINGPLGPAIDPFLRQASGFAAENEDILIGISRSVIPQSAVAGDQPGTAVAEPLEECIGALMDRKVQCIPVIETCAPHRIPAQIEPDRFDKMKPGMHPHTLARNISRIGRNFGLIQDNVQH